MRVGKAEVVHCVSCQTYNCAIMVKGPLSGPLSTSQPLSNAPPTYLSPRPEGKMFVHIAPIRYLSDSSTISIVVFYFHFFSSLFFFLSFSHQILLGVLLSRFYTDKFEFSL